MKNPLTIVRAEAGTETDWGWPLALYLTVRDADGYEYVALIETHHWQCTPETAARLRAERAKPRGEGR